MKAEYAVVQQLIQDNLPGGKFTKNIELVIHGETKQITLKGNPVLTVTANYTLLSLSDNLSVEIINNFLSRNADTRNSILFAKKIGGDNQLYMIDRKTDKIICKINKKEVYDLDYLMDLYYKA